MSKSKGASSSIPFDPFSQELPRNVRYYEASPSEYGAILDLVDDPRVVITKILKIENDVLESAYENTREKRKDFTEHLMFHGTADACADQISKYNFDWRLSGNKVGHKYGRGINFSPSFKYAAWYSDKSVYERLVIGAKVLIGKSCRGNPSMVLPPMGFDTTQNYDGRVVVKYEENEMFPAFKIYYHKHSFNNYYKNESDHCFHSDNQPIQDQYFSFCDGPQNFPNFNQNQNHRFGPPNKKFSKKTRWSPPPQNHGNFSNNHNDYNHFSNVDCRYGNNNDRFDNDDCRVVQNNDHFGNNGKNRWSPPSFQNNGDFDNDDCVFVPNDDHFVNNAGDNYFNSNGCFVDNNDNDQFVNDVGGFVNNDQFFDGNNRFVNNTQFGNDNFFVNNSNPFRRNNNCFVANSRPFVKGGNRFFKHGRNGFSQ